jgi:hypothetical protein
MSETPQQFAGQMLSLGGTSAIAAGEQLASDREDSRKAVTPLIYDGRGRCCLSGSAGERVEVLADELFIALAHSHSAPFDHAP